MSGPPTAAGNEPDFQQAALDDEIEREKHRRELESFGRWSAKKGCRDKILKCIDDMRAACEWNGQPLPGAAMMLFWTLIPIMDEAGLRPLEDAYAAGVKAVADNLAALNTASGNYYHQTEVGNFKDQLKITRAAAEQSAPAATTTHTGQGAPVGLSANPVPGLPIITDPFVGPRATATPAGQGAPVTPTKRAHDDVGGETPKSKKSAASPGAQSVAEGGSEEEKKSTPSKSILKAAALRSGRDYKMEPRS